MMSQNAATAWRIAALWTFAGWAIGTAAAEPGSTAYAVRWRRHVLPPCVVSTPPERQNKHKADRQPLAADDRDPRVRVDALSKQLQRSPRDVRALVERASAYLWLGDPQRSEADLALAAELAPRDARVWMGRGDLAGNRQDFEKALEAYNKAFDLGYRSRTLLVRRSYAYLETGQPEKARDDLLEAIRLSPGDLGRDYQLSERELSPRALEHGEAQVRKMLADRPPMAKYIAPGDRLWTWTVRKFAGEDTEGLVDWNSASALPFAGISISPQEAVHGYIRVSERPQNSSDTPWQRFNRLWAAAAFELHNVIPSTEWKRLTADARDGRIDRDDFIVGCFRTEELAFQRTRAFYLKYFLDWVHPEGEKSFPSDWPRFAFAEDPKSQLAEWQADLRWDYYSAWYDAEAADGEFARREYRQLERRIRRLFSGRSGLTKDQLSWLHGLLGEAYLAQNDAKGALGQFDMAIAIDPTSSAAKMGRGKALQAASRWIESVDQFAQVVQDEQSSRDAYYLRARAYWSLGQPDAAIADLDSAVGLDLEFTEGFLFRAYVFGQTGDETAALEDFATAIDLEPKRSDLYQWRGHFRAANGDYDDAIGDYSHAIQLAPDDSQPCLYRGKAYCDSQQYRQAWADYSRAIRLDPKNAKAFYARAELSMLWKQSGMPPCRATAVEDAWQSCVLTQWRSADHVELLAAAYAASGDASRARQWEQRASAIRRQYEAKTPHETKPGAQPIRPNTGH